MKRVKYLNNRDLLAQIHASKNTYCSYVDKEDARYDLIISDVKKINATAIAKARKARSKRLTQEAWEEAKKAGLKKIKLSDYTVSTRKIDKTELVFRVMTFDHIPTDSTRKKNPKQTSDYHTKCNFPMSARKMPIRHAFYPMRFAYAFKFSFFIKSVMMERWKIYFSMIV